MSFFWVSFHLMLPIDIRDFGNWLLPYKYGTYPALNVQFVQCMVGTVPNTVCSIYAPLAYPPTVHKKRRPFGAKEGKRRQ